MKETVRAGARSESCEEEEVDDCDTGRTLPAAESDCGASVTASLNVWSWNMKGGKILQELPQQLTS